MGDLFVVFGLMVNDGLLPDKYLVPTILKACAAVKYVMTCRMVHGYVLNKILEMDVFVGNALIDLYANCGDLSYSSSVFETMQERVVVSWTALLSAYLHERLLDEAENVFRSMELYGVKPDLISWSALVSGYAQNGEVDLALQVLEETKEKGMRPGVNTLNRMISGLRDLNLGKAVDGYAFKNETWGNVYVEGSLMSMYSIMSMRGTLKGHFSLLQFMQKEGLKTDLIAYDTLLAGYSREGRKNDAYELLLRMLFRFKQSPFGDCFSTEVLKATIQPNYITTATALAACADLTLLHQGKEIHGYIRRNNFEPNIILFSALVDTYMKCHDMDSATMVFCRIMERNRVSWNAFIAGHIDKKQPKVAFKLLARMLDEGVKPNTITHILLLQACADMAVLELGRAVHGLIIRSHLGMPNTILASAFLDMYSKCCSLLDAKTVFDSIQMDHLGVRPDKISFIAILSACARDGLVEDGWKYFNTMSYAYGVSASLEHYICMACRVHSNPEIGEIAAKALFKLEPNNASNYILLSNIYVSAGLWDLAKNLRSVMRGHRLIGIEEYSSTCLDTKIYEFKGGKSNYSKLEEFLELRDELAEEMGCERLALCSGILFSNNRHPIRVRKNIKMCIDRRTSVKPISKIADREIFVKDASLHHHMKGGICSCQERTDGEMLVFWTTLKTCLFRGR
ncbi:Pentatricopeptide repeat [Dillenia turbinata]|uniref:Pentatricopeptide repeat n=1 Tax=Dillenia turbinata TaxID=194707 RepID=A0AAN8ZI00_9MAGN